MLGFGPRVAMWLLLLGAVIETRAQDAVTGPEEVQALRERLTEREDETRVEEPLIVDFLGRPLALTGQYDVALEHYDRLALGDPAKRRGQLLLDQELELEAFYTFSKSLSFFAQLRLGLEEDLDSETPEGASGFFAERGEMWLFLKNVVGSRFSLDLGRLNFEDDRRWWWDEELDAVRLIYEAGGFEIAVAAAHEIAPARSDRSFIEPEHDGVFRAIAELSWDWRPDHAVQFFALFQNDRSATEIPRAIIRRARNDESEAELAWMGFRAAGACDFGGRGALGYWLDAGGVIGNERRAVAEELPDGIGSRG